MNRTETTTRRLIHAARRQGCVIVRRDAVGLGVTDTMLRRLVDSGVFRRAYPGVYVLAGAGSSPLLSPLLSARAALAAVPGAAASHGTAAWLAGMVDSAPAQVHLTVDGSRRHPRPKGIVVHRSHGPVTTHAFQGLRCTTAPRTLLDLAAVCGFGPLSIALDRAFASGVTRVEDVIEECSTSRRGAAALRACLRELGHLGVPQPSVLESRAARLFWKYGLPCPRAEVKASPDGRYRIDFAYPELRLAIEVYGYAWHHSPEQMASDLARQRELTLQGWRVLVFTWREVVYEPERFTGAVYRALESAANPQPHLQLAPAGLQVPA